MVGVPEGGSAAPVAADVDIDQYGRGEYDPDTETWEWYEVPPEVGRRLQQNAHARVALKWSDLLDRWQAVECDLHSEYGIDLDDTGTRDWRWLRTRIVGLTTSPTTRTWRALHQNKG